MHPAVFLDRAVLFVVVSVRALAALLALVAREEVCSAHPGTAAEDDSAYAGEGVTGAVRELRRNEFTHACVGCL